LRLAGIILLRPGNGVDTDLGGLVQRPGGIGQMRASDGAEIGAAGSDDRIGMIGLGNRTDGNGRNADFVADLVGERRLEEAAVDRLFFLPDLAR
jgi:hypothetical protein